MLARPDRMVTECKGTQHCDGAGHGRRRSGWMHSLAERSSPETSTLNEVPRQVQRGICDKQHKEERPGRTVDMPKRPP